MSAPTFRSELSNGLHHVTACTIYSPNLIHFHIALIRVATHSMFNCQNVDNVHMDMVGASSNTMLRM